MLCRFENKSVTVKSKRRSRVRWERREKAAVVYLRRHFGYSINVLAKAFQRSTSMIHKVLKRNSQLGLYLRDQRHIKDRVKKIGSQRMLRQLRFHMANWISFAIAKEGRPP